MSGEESLKQWFSPDLTLMTIDFILELVTYLKQIQSLEHFETFHKFESLYAVEFN